MRVSGMYPPRDLKGGPVNRSARRAPRTRAAQHRELTYIVALLAACAIALYALTAFTLHTAFWALVNHL